MAKSLSSPLSEIDSGDPRFHRNINRNWSFCYDPDQSPDCRRAKIDHEPADFHAVALPHTWHTYETTGRLHPFIREPAESDNPYWWGGWGWYRKVIELDNTCSGSRVFLEFDGVQKFCRVYCNEQLLAEHHGGFASFSVDITNAVKWGRKNLIAVAVSARQDDDFGGIPPMSAGNWALYGGIYRDVRLLLTHPVHIPFQGSAEHEGGTFVTTPEISRQSAVVKVITHLKNAETGERKVRVRQRILDSEGTIVSEFEKTVSVPPETAIELSQLSERIARPRLWTPESPYLYSVITTVLAGEELLDQVRSPLGFRWFHWDKQAGKLYLNDQPVRITGMNRHQEYPWLGDAVPRFIHEMDLRDMRYNLGVNFARWCHYTQDKMVYEWCDRHGILVCEEVPNIKNLPFGADVQRRQVVEMIRRDRNHPSIIMWSMGNETNNAADGRWAREEDETRLIHYRKVQGMNPEADHTHLDLDMENLLRCTVRGWWCREAMDKNTAPLPENHENGQITGTELFQHEGARVRDANIRARIDDDTVAWIYADHGADREYRNCPLKHVNPKGWVDAYRQPKLIYWLWQANRTKKLMVHIHEYWWRPERIGERCDIVVDSNGDTVDLYVGDKHVGTRYPGACNFYSVAFEKVEVEEKTLQAVARRGNQVVEHRLDMSGSAAALRLRSSHPVLIADRAAVALLSVDVVDKDNIPVFGARPPLHWTVKGPGTLVGPPDYVSDIDKREDRDGTMYTITPVVMPVRAGNKEGMIEVTVSSPDLKDATMKIESRLPDSAPERIVREPESAMPESGLTRLQKQRQESREAAKKAEQLEKEPILYADIVFESLDRREIQQRIWREICNLPGMRRDNRKVAGLVESLTDLAIAGNGILIADDVNFHLRQFYQE